jgi:hypothetical protein
MNHIVEVAMIKGRFFVFCAPDENAPVEVKSILISGGGGTVRLTKFCMERTRQCFGDAPASPWFRIDEDIDEEFLRAGNSVVFETRAGEREKAYEAVELVTA